MEIPICKDCGQPMIEICDTGRQVQIVDFPETGNMKVIGIRDQKLYQCPEDKTIAVD